MSTNCEHETDMSLLHYRGIVRCGNNEYERYVCVKCGFEDRKGHVEVSDREWKE